METTDQSEALAVIRATSAPIHDIGTAIYLSPDLFGWAAEWGWSNPFAFYFAGRGGMRVDVGAEVGSSAFGWFEPSAVTAFFDEGAAVKGASTAALQWIIDIDRGAESLTSRIAVPGIIQSKGSAVRRAWGCRQL